MFGWYDALLLHQKAKSEHVKVINSNVTVASVLISIDDAMVQWIVVITVMNAAVQRVCIVQTWAYVIQSVNFCMELIFLQLNVQREVGVECFQNKVNVQKLSSHLFYTFFTVRFLYENITLIIDLWIYRNSWTAQNEIVVRVLHTVLQNCAIFHQNCKLVSRSM